VGLQIMHLKTLARDTGQSLRVLVKTSLHAQCNCHGITLCHAVQSPVVQRVEIVAQ
jgi:hypothetical protein